MQKVCYLTVNSVIHSADKLGKTMILPGIHAIFLLHIFELYKQLPHNLKTGLCLSSPKLLLPRNKRKRQVCIIQMFISIHTILLRILRGPNTALTENTGEQAIKTGIYYNGRIFSLLTVLILKIT